MGYSALKKQPRRSRSLCAFATLRLCVEFFCTNRFFLTSTVEPAESVPLATKPTAAAFEKAATAEPLAPARYKVAFTASEEMRDKLPPPPVGLRRGFDEALAKSNNTIL